MSASDSTYIYHDAYLCGCMIASYMETCRRKTAMMEILLMGQHLERSEAEVGFDTYILVTTTVVYSLFLYIDHGRSCHVSRYTRLRSSCRYIKNEGLLGPAFFNI
jgi:hypothetical protein